MASWKRMAEIFAPWYIQIAQDARGGAVLHADETDWRMNGRTWWLWCFASHDTCRAVDRAESFGSHYTGTDHLLLTLALDPRGARLLRRYGVDPRAVVQPLRAMLSR